MTITIIFIFIATFHIIPNLKTFTLILKLCAKFMIEMELETENNSWKSKGAYLRMAKCGNRH